MAKLEAEMKLRLKTALKWNVILKWRRFDGVCGDVATTYFLSLEGFAFVRQLATLCKGQELPRNRGLQTLDASVQA